MTNKEIIAEIEVKKKELLETKGSECEVYSRSVGYYRPVKFWNAGKQEEFKDRKMYKVGE